MKVTVQVDRARIRQDLVFQYVEDPTIVRIEPEWSIVRYEDTFPTTFSLHLGLSFSFSDIKTPRETRLGDKNLSPQ